MPKVKKQDWQRVVRASRLNGGGSYRARVVPTPNSSGLILPHPRVFGGDGADLTGGTFDATRVRHDAGLGSSTFLRTTLDLADREYSERPFEENVWVRAGLKAFANAFSQMPFELWNGPPSEEGSAPIGGQDTNPLMMLMQKPNRLQSLMELVISHVVGFKHDGEVYWFLMRADGEPVGVNENTGKITEMPAQFLPVRGELVEHVLDDTGFPVAYRFQVRRGGVSSEFPWPSVIPFLDFDPYNIVRGLGDVRSLMREVDLYFQVFRYLDASVKNGGDPGGFITFDEVIGADELDRRQAEVDEEINTNANAGRYKILDRKAKFTPNPVSPKDMEYQSLQEYLRDSILAGIGVPPPVVGVLENSTYNNIDTARREMWVGPNGVLSLKRLIEDVMRNKLVYRLEGVAGFMGDVWPYWNPSDIAVLQEDRTDQIRLATETSKAGIGISFNDTLALQGVDVEPVDNGDEQWVSGSLRPFGEPPPAPVAPLGTDDDDEDEDEDEDDRVLRAALTPDPTLTGRIETWLDAYGKATIRAVNQVAGQRTRVSKASLEAIILNQREWAKRLARTTRVPIRNIWTQSIRNTHAVVGGPFLSITDPRVVDAIARQVIQLSEGVTSTTANRVKNAILRVLSGAQEGVPLREAIREVLPRLTKELRQVFGNNHNRALAIARTETGRAQNGAAFDQMKASEIERVRWLTAGDDKVRESHAALNETEIPLGETFPNGLRHPHDPDGPASEVVNCRCKLQAVVEAKA